MDNLFINKYKPSSIDELIFEDDFKKLLKILVNDQHLNLIICGNYSSGKTTILKLITNDYFCNIHEEEKRKNILHIHETKEQGIHYFRNELHLFCKTCSTIKNKKKIVILDDFDLINDQSQQVFRNLLDKYENNVIFIMTCTNIHKIINSIQSRQIIVEIPRLSKDKLHELCNKIINNENIHIDKHILYEIIDVSSYSIIRILNYLQKCKLIGNESNSCNYNQLFTHVNFNIFYEYFQLLLNHKVYDAINIINTLTDNGYSVIDILESFSIYLKDPSCNLLSEDQKYKAIHVVCKYSIIFYDLHENEVELIFMTNNLYKILTN